MTPPRPPTIPRQELTAATVAVKMDGVLRRELQDNLAQSIFWTDSMVVLEYLQNEATHTHISVHLWQTEFQLF